MEAYLDNNASTPLDPFVFEAMRPFFLDHYGNPSSLHQKGQAARRCMESARSQIAGYLDCEPTDLFFTSGGTEANNLALWGVLETFREIKKKDHLIVSAIEHRAILEYTRFLKTQGFQVTVIPVDSRGQIDLDFLKNSIHDRTALVSVMHTNNEVGTFQPVREIAQICQSRGVVFHSDAVQSFGKIPISVEKDGIDLLSFSGHKIYGPKGIGGLYVRKGIKLRPIFYGGHQEKGLRPGTENVAAAVGLAKAAELMETNRGTETSRIRDLMIQFTHGLRNIFSDIQINGDGIGGLYNTANLQFPRVDGESLLIHLDRKHIYVSTGSACGAGSAEPSHVLLAMGLSEKTARASVRFSAGRFTTQDEMDYALNEMLPIIKRLRKRTTC